MYVFEGRGVAKFVARTACYSTAALSVQISQKYKYGRHKQKSGQQHILARKKYTEKIIETKIKLSVCSVLRCLDISLVA
jgi:hypothetical protein